MLHLGPDSHSPSRGTRSVPEGHPATPSPEKQGCPAGVRCDTLVPCGGRAQSQGPGLLTWWCATPSSAVEPRSPHVPLAPTPVTELGNPTRVLAERWVTKGQ